VPAAWTATDNEVAAAGSIVEVVARDAVAFQIAHREQGGRGHAAHGCSCAAVMSMIVADRLLDAVEHEVPVPGRIMEPYLVMLSPSASVTLNKLEAARLWL